MAVVKRPTAGRASRARSSRRGAKPARRTSDGAAAVRHWLSAVKPEHRPIVKKIDALIRKTVPKVRPAVKWHQAFYGVEGLGWIVAVTSYTNYVSLTFFAGTRLDPVPPLGEHKDGRRVNIHATEDYDEKQLRRWLKQAGSIRGWGTV